MKTVTLRNFPPELIRIIRQKAQEKGTSLNKAVISLLEESVGIRRTNPKALHHDLDALSGSWTNEEVLAFENALAQQRAIDPDLWK